MRVRGKPPENNRTEGRLGFKLAKVSKAGKGMAFILLFVVIHNLLLGLGCLWVAWKLWMWRRSLIRLSYRIVRTEKAVHRVLAPAPEHIRAAQRGTHDLRLHYEQLGIQYERIQQLMGLLSLLQMLWPYRRFLTGMAKPFGLVPVAPAARRPVEDEVL